jgi:hypothetical protein
MSRVLRPRVLGLALALLLVAAGTSLLGGGRAAGNRAPGDPGETVRLTHSRVSHGAVVGRIGRRARVHAVRRVGRVVDRWLDAAYVDASYPRHRFGASLRVFTRDGRHRARRDLRLLTNADLGPRIDGVVVHQRRVRVDLLATRGRARAATARVLLTFRTTGRVRRHVHVLARLFLVPTAHGWRIFGYDVKKGRR